MARWQAGEATPGTALLVVRAWYEGPGRANFRARLWQTPDVGTVRPLTRVVTSVDELTALVDDWLATATAP